MIVFTRTLSRSWLALTIAVPYMLIVVAMGYVRQRVALGLIMTGLAWLQRGNYLRYLVWVLIAGTFHKSAIVMVPFALLFLERNRIFQILMVGLMCLAGFVWLLKDSIGHFFSLYLEAGYASDGSFVRLLMTLVPALIFLILFRSFNFSTVQKKIWFWMSIFAILLFAILFFSPSSTAVDRIALYLLPLQLVVFASLPDIFGYPFPNKKIWMVSCDHSLLCFGAICLVNVCNA